MFFSMEKFIICKGQLEIPETISEELTIHDEDSCLNSFLIITYLSLSLVITL